MKANPSGQPSTPVVTLNLNYEERCCQNQNVVCGNGSDNNSTLMPARLQHERCMSKTKSDQVNAVQLKQRLLGKPQVADVAITANGLLRENSVKKRKVDKLVRKHCAMIGFLVLFRIFTEQNIQTSSRFVMHCIIHSLLAGGKILHARLRISGGYELNKQDDNYESHAAGATNVTTFRKNGKKRGRIFSIALRLPVTSWPKTS